HQPVTPGLEIGPHQALATQPGQNLHHLAIGQPLVAVDDDVVDQQHVRLGGDDRSAVSGVSNGGDGGGPDDHRLQHRIPPAFASRLDVGAAEAPIRPGGDGAHGFNASTRRSGTDPIDPAPSVITMSPGFATRTIAGTTSSSRATTSSGT